MNELNWLCRWYQSNCDGDWEHGYGIRIDTPNNHEWSININVEGTELEGKEFAEVFQYNSDSDWISCKVENNFFKGNCDPTKLEATLKIFRTWQESVGEEK